MSNQSVLMLAGDVGGTKTNLAVFAREEGLRRPLAEASFVNREYPHFTAVIRDFLKEHPLPVKHGAIGAAGPIVKGRVDVTNLPWQIDAKELMEALNFQSITLLNDLVAFAGAVPVLEEEDVLTLNAGAAEPTGPMAVIAPGTGLGEAYLTWAAGAYHTHPSEGGHTDFAPRNEKEMALLRFLQKQYDHVSYERICAGIGVPNVYRFAAQTAGLPSDDDVWKEVNAATDATPVIIREGMKDGGCPVCREALRLFVSILGAEAGNLALKVLATGGVYIGGGIPPRILPLLREPGFLKGFQEKGRFTDTMKKMPLHVILNPKVALMGAARSGWQQLDFPS
ncbi:MAG: glucokinase [Bacillota bacterium]|nr:glucokinase [Bacillota bacterium]MDW7676743.1 glucokinase [Bacillota bacterium]